MAKFKCKETEKVYNGIFSECLSANIQEKAYDKLHMITNTPNLNKLRKPPANHLKKLQGKRKGQYSVRINDQYRICFKWSDNHAYDMEIVDYH